MPSPFPGMDPFIEQPAYWASFHSRLIVALANAIEAGLGQEYYVEVEVRSYLSEGDESLLVDIPDAIVFTASIAEITDSKSLTETAVATLPQPQPVKVPMPESVKERYLEVREVGSDRVITVIEALSPKNKRSGQGRTSYEDKRLKILSSLTHLVEIDLLRGGESMPVMGSSDNGAYSILVSRSEQRPSADLYSFGLQNEIPSFALPLSEKEQLLISLQEVCTQVYEQARYRSRIDYQQSLAPALSIAEQTWVTSLLEM
ncbi:MAG: DUF4058 family protein [Cyanobacteria bacterium P01_C01_bin.118]